MVLNKVFIFCEARGKKSLLSLWFSRPNQRFLVWFRTEEFRHDSSPELFLDACYTNICIGKEMKPLRKDENEKTAISY